jgi:transcriptional regulator with GAF, ATPase, and Fis domain
VGGTTPKKVDVRFIFATNKDLKIMVSHGTFREDLYYRLNVVPISIPPLRERKEDISTLVNHFLQKCNNKIGKKIEKISDSAMELIINYDWVGNVRQLENFIERLVILVDDNVITESHLPTIVQKVKVEEKPHIPKNSRELKKLKKEIKQESIQDIEKTFIIEALNRNGWNVTKSAKDVGMQRPNFQLLMRKYNIKSPNNRR